MFAKERKDVKSVFGTYTIGTDGPEITADTLSADSIYDYLVRQDGRNGLQAKMKFADRGIEAMTSPDKFFEDKQKDLVKIVGILKESAKNTFQRYLNRNIPVKEAREKTRKDLDAKFLTLMKDHEEDFPKDILSKIVTKLVGN